MKSLISTIGLAFIIFGVPAAFSRYPSVDEPSVVKRELSLTKTSEKIKKLKPSLSSGKDQPFKLNILQENDGSYTSDTEKDEALEKAKSDIVKKLRKLYKKCRSNECDTIFPVIFFASRSSNSRGREIDSPICIVRCSEFSTNNGVEESSSYNLSSNENRGTYLLLNKPQNKYYWVELKAINGMIETIDPTSIMTLITSCGGGDEDKPPAKHKVPSEPDDLLVFSYDEDDKSGYWILFENNLINLTIPGFGTLSAAIAQVQVQQHEAVPENTSYGFGKYTVKRGLRGGSKNPIGGAYQRNNSITNNNYFSGGFNKGKPSSGSKWSTGSRIPSTYHKGAKFGGGGGNNRSWGSSGFSGGGGQATIGSAKKLSKSSIPGSK